MRRIKHKIDIENRNAYSKAIYLQITQDLYQQVKHQAKERNIPLRKWVTRAIIKMLIREGNND